LACTFYDGLVVVQDIRTTCYLQEFESRKERPESEITEDVAPTTDSSLTVHRTWGRRALRRIRARVQLQSRLASRRRQLRDIVTEDLVPDIG
jgi:hypothetical protein